MTGAVSRAQETDAGGTRIALAAALHTAMLGHKGVTALYGKAGPVRKTDLAALHTLEARIGTGRWSGTTPADLNVRATEADPASPARYVSYAPAACPRPYDRTHSCDGPRR
ncbi:hypothetical protein AB0I98_38275 [Streptomyces sp. NPDC050211]|uniref:hypothetical protein n=1 Tax=Streptomyces sp. NPDC050211 TaxID=3154932 RepID=UPI00342E84C3